MFGIVLRVFFCFSFLMISCTVYSQTILPQQTNAVLGARSVLVIRGLDPATHTWDVADSDLTSTQAALDAYVRKSSFDKAWIGTFDITPVYEFTVGGNLSYTYMSDTIRNLAIADGYNVNDYNVIIYTYRSTTDLNGAGALGGGNGLNGSVWMPGQLFGAEKGVIHEVFHAFGMGHAENIEGGDVMFPGPSNGGHDPYHFMGSEQGDADIPNYMKYMLGWIDPTEIHVQSLTPATCETIRVHEASFIDAYDNSKKYSMQLGDDLWVSYVPETDNPNMVTHGVLLHHIPNPGAGLATPRIIDTEPASISTLPPGVSSNYLPVIDFWDAAMEVGEEVFWEGATIKVVSTGGTGDEQWVDIEICQCIQISGDTDNDGICDAADQCEGFDDSLDSDFDLIPNDCDICPNDPNNDSNNDNICDDVQCLSLVKETFDYVAATDINTTNGGVGFNGNWTMTEGENNGFTGIEAGSLTYGDIVSTGNKLRTALNDETVGSNLERNISPGFGTGQTMWLSTIIKANVIGDGGFWIRPDKRQDMAIGKRWGTNFSIDNTSTGISMSAGETYFLVAKYEMQPSQILVYLWVNPTEADLLDVTTAHSTKTVGAGDIESMSIRLERYGVGDFEMDELTMDCNPPELVNIGKSIQLKAFLQGALLNSPDGLMRDDLRDNSLLPLIEPYSTLSAFTHYGNGGNETTNTILTNNGNSSIVDWLLVELRDANDASIVVETQSVLLQKDGQIVDVNGNNKIAFNVNDNDYYVALRHRNHFGIMTANTINLTGNSIVDFTDINTPTYGANACVDMGNGVQALWAGNCSADDQIIFSGNNNDVNVPFFEVLQASNNTTNQSNYIETNYLSGDVDLNGKVIFQGNNNEQNFIFFNVLSHPSNTASIIYIIEEQLP